MRGGRFGLSSREAFKLNRFRDRFDHLPVDPHLNAGEGDRYRRYGRFSIDPMARELKLFEHDLFFQSKRFDILYGDIHRNFAPMTQEEFGNSLFQALLIESFQSLPVQNGVTFEVSAHLIRIQAAPHVGAGRPAPEGIHRDGYHFGSIHLMNRKNVKGAVNNVYDLKKTIMVERTLEEPLDSIYFDDRMIYHGVTPFDQKDHDQTATRDMLILLYQPLSESPQRARSTRLVRRY